MHEVLPGTEAPNAFGVNRRGEFPGPPVRQEELHCP